MDLQGSCHDNNEAPVPTNEPEEGHTQLTDSYVSTEQLTNANTLITRQSHDLLLENPFQRQVTKFMEAQSDVMECLCYHDNNQPLTISPPNFAGAFGDTPPIEYLMKVDPEYRTKELFKLLVPGHVVQGYVVNKCSTEVTIRVTSLVEFPKKREIYDLRIMGVVKMNDSDLDKMKQLVDDLQYDDVVRAVIVYINEVDEILELSFESTDPNIKLGYIEDEGPITSSSESTTYIDTLSKSIGFKNPYCIENLKNLLKVPSGSHSSLLRPILMKTIKEEDYYDSLRKVQRRKWSMETVATGVKLLKAKQIENALRYFNYALEIDAENVEAMVARGALYANSNKYENAIADFEAALTLNHTHYNAKKYLVETQTAYGQELEKLGKLKSALRCYREALADNPSTEPAKTRAALLTSILEKKAAEQRERERKQLEKARLKKLKKIIDKERHKKHKKAKRRKKSSSKRKKREESDSSSSDANTSHDRSHDSSASSHDRSHDSSKTTPPVVSKSHHK